jgi:uncharacterized Ntn-hydrolase superfamily protein
VKNLLALALLLFAITAVAQQNDAPRPLRPVHTFSIVARDPQTGEIGVAVQSHWFAVGQIVPWAEPGVGAVATQSFVEPNYGPLGLDLMRAGKSAPDALEALLTSDAAANVRQVAMIDSEGDVAAWTGSKNIQAAGNKVGSGCGYNTSKVKPESRYLLNCFESMQREVGGSHIDIGSEFSVQANLMSNPKIWPAMFDAYYKAKDGGADLAERMLAALDAAQAAGGDIRGRQSAALIIVSGKRSTKPWERIFDLRVDDNPEPLKELRRLVALQRAYNHMNAGDLAVEHHDNEAALREYSAAEVLASKTPGVDPSRLAEMIYWHAVALVNMGRVNESLPLFKKAFDLVPGWRELTTRLPQSGLLPDDPKLIERITAVK